MRNNFASTKRLLINKATNVFSLMHFVCGQRPGLGGRAVCGVEPHLGALARVAPLAVERHAARRARDRPAAAAGLDAPELRRGSVGLGKGCGAAGCRERQPAARQPVEPRRLVVGERQSRPRRAQRAAGRAGRHGHAAVERGRQAVVAVVEGPLQYGCFVFCFQVVLSAPFADRFLGDVRSRGQLNPGALDFPLPQIHRIRNNPILNPRDARREGLVVSVDGKALFLGIQVLLNAIGILLGPFIGLVISHKVIV